jgi:medium-chain acyl-[acyl-carrier-protein] hydrolase
VPESRLAQRWLPWSGGATDLPVVYCLPYAGGSAQAYRPWIEPGRAHGVELMPVELPGHGTRWQEEPFGAMDEIVRALCQEVIAHSRGPYALFGHSMGGMIAFEIAVAMAAGPGGPGHLFLSAVQSPGAPAGTLLHRLSDDRLVEAIRELGGTPTDVSRNPAIMSFLLPVIRADMRIVETWRPVSGRLVSCPVSVFSAFSDTTVNPEAMSAWSEVTSAAFRQTILPGGHFYLHERRDDLLCGIGAALRQ